MISTKRQPASCRSHLRSGNKGPGLSTQYHMDVAGRTEEPTQESADVSVKSRQKRSRTGCVTCRTRRRKCRFYTRTPSPVWLMYKKATRVNRNVKIASPKDWSVDTLLLSRYWASTTLPQMLCFRKWTIRKFKSVTRGSMQHLCRPYVGDVSLKLII